MSAEVRHGQKLDDSLIEPVKMMGNDVSNHVLVHAVVLVPQLVSNGYNGTSRNVWRMIPQFRGQVVCRFRDDKQGIAAGILEGSAVAILLERMFDSDALKESDVIAHVFKTRAAATDIQRTCIASRSIAVLSVGCRDVLVARSTRVSSRSPRNASSPVS